MTMQQQSLERIAHFLDQLKLASTSQKKIAQARTMRLTALFDTISRFRRETAVTPDAPARTIDPVRFSSFLGDLQTSLITSRRDGSLLNVWSIAGLKRNEVRTSAVLGWVLDCNGSHGFGSAFLAALIKRLQEKTGSEELKALILGRHYRVSVEHSSFGERDNRVDIAIEGANCVIFVEVKIDALEGPEQLNRYSLLARRKAMALRKDVPLVLYLNKTCPPNSPVGLVWMRWQDIASAILDVITGPAEKTVSGAVLKQFANHVSRLN